MFYPYISKLFKGRSESVTQQISERPAVTSVPLPFIARVGQSLFALFILLITAYVVYEAKWGFGSWEPRAALFPWAIGLPTLVLALYVFIEDSLQSSRKVKVEEYHVEDEPEIDRIVARQRTVAISCWIVGFFLAIWIIGFIPASAIATLLYLKYGAGERWPVTAAISVACWLFFWGMFDYALQMPFPRGALFDWLPVKIADVQWPFLG
jgi:hypothetical protein